MASYLAKAVGTTVVLNVRTPDPAGATNLASHHMSVAEARDIAAELIEAAEAADKADAKARADRAIKLRGEIDRLINELNALEGSGSKTYVVGVDLGKEH
ncbi:hypothetical protein AB4037_29090 [Labrys sp. KB_33_2]|uniref:hypothetical protein n=1 Tax=Labrys sp. KB_33_2 TaxID=3237479 RepID=UPI003F932069